MRSLPDALSITAIAWCTSFSKLEIRRVSRRSCRRLRIRPTAAALPNDLWMLRILVGCCSPDARADRVPMAGGAANVADANVLDLVLLAGGPAFVDGAGAGAGRRRLVALASRRMKVSGRWRVLIASAALMLATLGSDCSLLLLSVATVIDSLMLLSVAAVIDRVVRRFSSLLAFCTLGSGWVMLVGADVSMALGFVGAEVRTMVGLRWIICCVASTNSCSSRASCPVLPAAIPCIADTHSLIACMILSACVIVGLVMFLCWNWMVSVRRSPRVALMAAAWVR